MERYDPIKIESKWQKIWEQEKPYHVDNVPKGAEAKKPKMMLAEMFPYPSGAGLHVGHVRNFTIVDVLTRFYEQQGVNVMRPFGYDTFGLPAENYAIKTGTSPQKATRDNIANFKKQAKRLGYAIDWDREISTSAPEYYKWTQWCFLQLYKKGLAYRKESYQWWCPEDQTVLANEQVEDGKCWRCGHAVEKKKMKQWFFKITDYADELLEGIDALDWPDKIKTMQKNWIGKSVGAEIDFALAPSSPSRKITVFTTRPDTIKGATFIVLAPEYPGITHIVTDDAREKVESYCAEALRKSEVERQENKEKTGVFTGANAINPATGEEIPVYVADYVLGGYGTGAIMGVPAMDDRDKEFAEKMHLPIVETELVDFGQYGTPRTTYKMRDWLISRQRYWGCPIPIAYDKEGNPHPIPEDQLPVLIPEIEDYQPDTSGRSALAKATDWLKVDIPVKDPETGEIHMEQMTRETDTLDGYACSSWYLWRYASPHDAVNAWNAEAVKYWEPTDVYVGADHAVAHLLYVRFWCKFFADLGYLPFREPIKKLIYHGYINAPDGKKMSKSKGNVIDPLDVINDGYGADTLRTYEMFIGPVELDAAWNPRSVGGVYRFLNRCYNLCFTLGKIADAETTATIRHRTIKKVTEDIHKCNFNTAVAAMMEYVNELYKVGAANDDLIALAQLLKPFAPHLASEMLEKLNATDDWPTWDERYLAEDTAELVVQINGKLRATLSINLSELEDEKSLTEKVLADPRIAKYTADGYKKIIFVKKAKLINIVV
ncbi:leucine--tRNA ligase [Candidatus Saccharibacteria bacterium]|nr:leucine--tRNA ligase [Candidatus Saccharibacteria bacterium]